MEEKAFELINLLEKELDLYTELLFNEMDKGVLLYEHDLPNFNTKNECSSMILNEISSIIEAKKNILEDYRKKMNNDSLTIEDIIKEYGSDRLEYYNVLKSKLKNILNNLSEINMKNKIILDTTYSISKIILDGLNKENIYNEKGSLCENNFSTVRYSV